MANQRKSTNNQAKAKPPLPVAASVSNYERSVTEYSEKPKEAYTDPLDQPINLDQIRDIDRQATILA